MAHSDELLDCIYEAAVIPELWPELFEKLAQTTESAWGALVAVRDGAMSNDGVSFTGSSLAQQLFGEFVQWGRPEANLRVVRGGATAFHEFMVDHDIFTPEELVTDPFYAEFLRPRGYGWFAGTRITSHSGEIVAINVERTYARGPYERRYVELLNDLRPHLARASMLSARLSLERARAATDALERVGLAAAVLGARGRTLSVNPLFSALMPKVIMDRRERVALANPAADRLLAEALERLPYGDKNPGVRSIPLAARDEQVPMIVHVVPVRRAAHDIFAQGESILVVTQLSPRGGPSASLLQGLFDLTPAEARVAHGILDGKGVDAVASLFGISRETVRTQLKNVFAKTGTAGQSALVALLTGTALS